MAREKNLESLVLKKHDYGETDQIVTIFSKEEGKLRCLVKAAKLATSKLHPSLQPLFLSYVTLVGSGSLPKVIRVQPIKSYGEILVDQTKITAWFVVSEFIIRALPDGLPNEPLFQELKDYLVFINDTELSEAAVILSAVQFQIKALDLLGYGVRVIAGDMPDKVWLSMDQGGFFAQEPSVSAETVPKEAYELFLSLKQQPYNITIMMGDNNRSLQKLVERFVAYQLEREIKSSQFLKPGMV